MFAVQEGRDRTGRGRSQNRMLLLGAPLDGKKKTKATEKQVRTQTSIFPKEETLTDNVFHLI